MSYIFISYSHEDKEYAHKLEKKLKPKGFDVWLDDRIDYGSQWPDEIEKRLDSCSALILIMTPRSKKSEWVQNELNRAKRKKKKIFPLLLDGDEPWLSVEATQYVDVRTGILPPENFYDSLSKVVPKKVIAPSATTTESPSIWPKELFSLGKYKNKDLKTNEIVEGLNNLADKEKYSSLLSSEIHHLMVGECEVSYRGFLAYEAVKDERLKETYSATLYLAGSNESKTYAIAMDPQYELIQKLIKLGWKDIRSFFPELKATRPLSRFGGIEKQRPTLEKSWEKDTDLDAIANFLIDTNDLLSIKPSEINVNLEKIEFGRRGTR